MQLDSFFQLLLTLTYRIVLSEVDFASCYPTQLATAVLCCVSRSTRANLVRSNRRCRVSVDTYVLNLNEYSVAILNNVYGFRAAQTGTFFTKRNLSIAKLKSF